MYDNTIEYAIQYHHNKIAEWLYENYQQNIELDNQITNTEFTLYLINNHSSSIDVKDYLLLHRDDLLLNYLRLKQSVHDNK